MFHQHIQKGLFGFYLSCLVVLSFPLSAWAVPSFARQTGMSCTACHTVFPELTSFGRTFKLGGYTFSIRGESQPYVPPVAAMFQASITALDKNNGVLNNGVAPFDNKDDRAIDEYNLPQQASVFYGGKIYDGLGAFAQVTYDGTANDIALDNTDIRYARTDLVGGKHLVWGVAIDNDPTVGDVWNTTFAWSFPYASSAVAPTPAASALIDGGLAQQVGGIGAYALWADLVYASFRVYRTTYDGIASPLGAGTDPDTITDGAVPYWRVALQHQWNKHYVELGTYGMQADVYPGGGNSGPTNCFTDYGFDAQYQYSSNPHLFSLETTWIHENQDWDASYAAGMTSNPSDTLNTFKANANYYYRSHYGTLGGTLAYFSTTGGSDQMIYAPDPVDGSRTGSPDSNGFIFEADYVLKEKYRFSLQYTAYTKFNGASSNYDGFGRDASDNNTFYAVAWLMF